MRTREQFMSEIDAILARYIAGGYGPEPRPERAGPVFFMVTKTRAELAEMFPPTCPCCREELGGKLICQCHPELNGESQE